MGVSAFVAQNEGAQTYDALHVSSSPDRRASATPGFDLAAGTQPLPECHVVRNQGHDWLIARNAF